jgi:hypothetical protein
MGELTLVTIPVKLHKAARKVRVISGVEVGAPTLARSPPVDSHLVDSPAVDTDALMSHSSCNYYTRPPSTCIASFLALITTFNAST